MLNDVYDWFYELCYPTVQETLASENFTTTVKQWVEENASELDDFGEVPPSLIFTAAGLGMAALASYVVTRPEAAQVVVDFAKKRLDADMRAALKSVVDISDAFEVTLKFNNVEGLKRALVSVKPARYQHYSNIGNQAAQQESKRTLAADYPWFDHKTGEMTAFCNADGTVIAVQQPGKDPVSVAEIMKKFPARKENDMHTFVVEQFETLLKTTFEKPAVRSKP